MNREVGLGQRLQVGLRRVGVAGDETRRIDQDHVPPVDEGERAVRDRANVDPRLARADGVGRLGGGGRGRDGGCGEGEGERESS